MRVGLRDCRPARPWRWAFPLAAIALALAAASPALAAGGSFREFNAPFTGSSDFVTGFSTCIAGPTGQLFAAGRVFIVDLCTGRVLRFPLSGGSAKHPEASANLSFSVMLASSHGTYYGVGSGGLYRWDPDSMKLGPLVNRLTGSPRGVVADPLSTDLLVTTSTGAYRVSDPESASARATQVIQGDYDGVAVTSDGQRFYLADSARGHVIGLNRQWSRVFDVDLGSHGADGISVAQADARVNGVDLGGDIFVNSNDGTIERIDTHNGNALTVVASGGSRGDVTVVGPDGCLYATQSDRVVKLDPCFFQPTGDNHGRSSLAGAIPSLNDLRFDPISIAASVAITAVLGLMIVFPGELFNSTLQEHYDEIKGWLRFGRRKSGTEEPKPPRTQSRARRWRTLAAVTIVGAAIYCLLDPRFGLDLASLAAFIGVVVALVGTLLGFAFVYGLVLRVTDHDHGHLRAYPAALLVAAACVLISRWTGFVPGYCYGLMAAFVVSGAPPRPHHGRASAIASLVLLVLSIGAWLLWTPINAAVSSGTPGFPLLLLDATLASLFLFGLQTAVFGLVPIRYLEGEKVAAWNRVVWGVLFGIGLFAFVHILLNPNSGYLPRPGYVSPVTVALLFLGFGAFSVAFWGFFKLRERGAEKATAP